MKMNKPETGRWEKRAVQAVELREDTGADYIFEGYASVFNAPYEVLGGPDEGGWTEVVDPVAFNRTLKSNPDVGLKIEHSGLSIAKTSAGTLELRTDAHGLKVVAHLDPQDPDVQGVVPKIRRKNVSQMSFAFWTVKQEWDEDRMIRRLLEVRLDGGDVSIVDQGASPHTSIEGVRGAAGVLSELNVTAALAEVRSSDDLRRVLSVARDRISKLLAESEPPPTMSLVEFRKLSDMSADSALKELARLHPVRPEAT